jgi:hypothetical protein
MALKNGKPNALNYFNLRRVEFSAPHFRYTTVEKYSPNLVRSLDTWIKRSLLYRASINARSHKYYRLCN